MPKRVSESDNVYWVFFFSLKRNWAISDQLGEVIKEQENFPTPKKSQYPVRQNKMLVDLSHITLKLLECLKDVRSSPKGIWAGETTQKYSVTKTASYYTWKGYEQRQLEGRIFSFHYCPMLTGLRETKEADRSASAFLSLTPGHFLNRWP